MNSQCFDSRADQGNCLKHKPWISMHKFVYISEQVRQFHPNCVAAIEHAASSKCSNTKIITEKKKDATMARVLRKDAAKVCKRHIWICTNAERKSFTGFNVMSIKMFRTMTTHVLPDMSLMGNGGR